MPIFGTNSSINAGGYGFLGAPIRTVQSSVAPRNLTEGNVITVTVTSDDIPDGTTLYYSVRGTLGTITASDFVDNSLTGTFTINNDSGSFTKAIASDGVIEEGEGFVIDIRSNSHTGQLLETTQSVYIQGSTSTGIGGVDNGQGGSTFHDFGADGNLIFDANTSTSFTYTAATDVKLKAYLWGQGGTIRGGQGGYSYGTFHLLANEVLHIRLNYGGGNHGNEGGSGNGASGDGGGLAGIFSSSTINQSNARLIAGGGGGGANPVGGSGSVNGGGGGGPSGSGGDNSPDTQQGSTGGGGASQSSGGGGGGHGGSSGSALQGGRGGNGTGSHPNYAGGGGGGGGYYGGGGGGGGNDDGNTSRSSSGGGGGSGYVHSSVINGFTGGFASGQNHPDREDAGESGQNAKVVFEGVFTFDYRGNDNDNDTYSVNVPANSTSMTAKVWGAGGYGIGECPSNGTGLDGGNFSGGSGGHVEGTIPVTGGSIVTVWVGGTNAGSQPGSMAQSGAGDGGGFAGVKYGSNLMIAGGGGGAGQASNGGYGGGNGSGGGGSGGLGGPNSGGGGSQSGGGGAGSSSGNPSGSGRYFSSSGYNGYYRNNGGDSGGHGTYQGKRGGGGGAGYYGGGGGGGYDSSCSGGGGGGGSGIITGNWTNTVSEAGQTGQAGGRSARDTNDSEYISGYGGSGQNGLVVIVFE